MGIVEGFTKGYSYYVGLYWDSKRVQGLGLIKGLYRAEGLDRVEAQFRLGIKP